MSDERENVDLADDEEYDRIWEIFVNSSSPALKANWTVLQQSMEENNYIGKSITLLDIGAGHGEKSRWLKEMGVNLNYVYAVEPNHNHAQRTKTTLQTLGLDNDVDERPFTEDFSLLPHKNEEKFDLVLICHTAYHFIEKLESTIQRAHTFVRPEGKLLIINNGESEVQRFKEHVLPKGHFEALSSTTIISRLVQRFPAMRQRTYQGESVVDVDDIVCGTADKNSLSNVFLSVLLWSPYEKISPEMQKRAVNEIISFNNVKNERYHMNCVVVGVEISTLI